MSKQPFDHSEFIAGTLNRHQQVGWADQVVLDQGPRSIWLMQAKHIVHSNGRRGFDLQIEKYAKKTNREAFGHPEKSFPLSEQAVVNLFDCLQRQQALERSISVLAISRFRSTRNRVSQENRSMEWRHYFAV
jgi:hypothetical protein